MPEQRYETSLVPHTAEELPEYLSRELRDIANALSVVQEQLNSLDSRVSALEP